MLWPEGVNFSFPLQINCIAHLMKPQIKRKCFKTRVCTMEASLHMFEHKHSFLSSKHGHSKCWNNTFGAWFWVYCDFSSILKINLSASMPNSKFWAWIDIPVRVNRCQLACLAFSLFICWNATKWDLGRHRTKSFAQKTSSHTALKCNLAASLCLSIHFLHSLIKRRGLHLS